MTTHEIVTQHQILRERIQAAKRVHQHELELSNSENSIWKDYGSQTTDYALAFPDFLRPYGFDTFAQFLEHFKYKNQWQHLYVLDVAAPLASFVGQHAVIDGGMAITLSDTRTDSQKITDSLHIVASLQGICFKDKHGNIFEKLCSREEFNRLSSSLLVLMLG